jgi:hypothetical protein
MSKPPNQNPPRPHEPIHADPSKYKKVRAIADTLISLRPGDSIAFIVMGVPKTMGGGVERWKNNAPPTVLPIEVLPERRAALLILQTVLESKFEILGEEALNRSYLVEAGETVAGKRYRDFDVTEIEYED